MEHKPLLRILIAYTIYKLRHKRTISLYIRPLFLKRHKQGDLQLIHDLANDPSYHHRYFRMDKRNFEFILEKLRNKISHFGNHVRPISALERVSMTLRYLATGNSQISLTFSFRVSPSSVQLILRETLTAMCEEMKHFIAPPTNEKWAQIALKFQKVWNFPNCCGAIDGKHVRTRAPAKSGSSYYNYKNYFSTVLLAVVDSTYCFSLVHIGKCGSNSDSGIFGNCEIGKAMEDKKLQLPPPKELKQGDQKVPHVILGDEDFPLKRYLLRPFPGKYLAKSERIFNYRLSRARMVSENAFGIMAARWRILHTAIYASSDLVNLIIKTSVILHN